MIPHVQVVWHLLVHSFNWKCSCWCVCCCFTPLIPLKILSKFIQGISTCLLLPTIFSGFNGCCCMELLLQRECLSTRPLVNCSHHFLGILLARTLVWSMVSHPLGFDLFFINCLVSNRVNLWRTWGWRTKTGGYWLHQLVSPLETVFRLEIDDFFAWL